MVKNPILKVSTFVVLLLSVVMVFAACGKMEFKVDFIVDDAVYATINTNGEEVLKMPNDPEKDGYVFDGWYWDKDSWKKPFSANSLLDAPLSSNMSVYAKWTTPEQVKGTQAEFAEFDKVTETEYSMKVSNSTASVSLGSLVTVNSRSSWTLSSDIYGNQTIASKTATLAVGDNTYYVLVTAENGATQLYTLKIRRRPVYSVIFDTNGGASVENQKVEEDSLAEAPTTTKTGYSFASWNYDFTVPVTENKIVVASWTANTYKITYNTNGGDIANKTADVVYDSAFTLENPTRRGYDFDGWYYGETPVTNGVWNYDADITLDARWNATEYSLSYNLNGGVLSGNNPLKYTVESDNITLVNPTRAGYVFAGWTGTDLGEPTLIVTIDVNSLGNREYTANWVLDGYSITYNLNGGTNSESNPSAYAVTSANIYLENATRRGYAFEGWYTNADCAAESKITTITSGSTGDIVLYAKWSLVNYNIKYNLDGGGVDGTNPNSYTIESADITLINPTKRGYRFVGWTGTDLIDIVGSVTIRNNSIGDRTYTAVWEIVDYSIKYNLNGGTNSEANPEKYNVASATITLENPTKLGYVFGGWYTSNDFNEDERVKTVPNGSVDDIELFAKWVPATYSVRFNKNNSKATGTMDSQSLTYGLADTLTANRFALTGYTFRGWTTNSDGTGTLYANEQEVLNLSSENGAIVNVYAKWEANTYTVTFDKNGGEMSVDSQIVTFDAIYTLPTPTRTGYTFVEWNTEADGSGTSYGNSAAVNNLTTENNGTVVLYAQWRANTYRVSLATAEKTFTVSFNLNGASGTAPSAQTVNNTRGLTYPSIPARSGYIFGGWYTTSSCSGNPYDFASEVTSDITLYAKWVQPNSCTGILSMNGSTGSISYGQSIKYYAFVSLVDQTITLYTTHTSGDPKIYLYNASKSELASNDDSDNRGNRDSEIKYNVKAGALYYVGFGCYSSSNGTGCLYLVGSATPSAGGKTVGSTTSSTTIEIAVTFGSSFTLSTDISRTGYTFAGWYDGVGGTGTQYADAHGNSVRVWDKEDNATLYAKWEVNTYTVTLDKNEGTGGTNSITASYDSAMPTATAPTYTGYNFAGYYDADGVQYYDAEMRSVRNWDKAEDTTLYARWNGKTFNVSFDRQNGTGGTASVAATFNSNMPSASAPSRTGYIFKGYFDGRNGTGTQYYSASMTSLHKWDKSSAGTLYAYWEARTHTVSFNYNNGTGNTNSVIATYDSAMPTISGIPTRTGYIFTGYYDSANNGTKYYNADLTSARTWDKTSNTTLYAHWVGVDYSVRFEGNGSTSGRMNNQAFVYATAQNLSANAYARTGYTFVGWNTEADGSGTSYGNSASVNNLTTENNGTVVLYAQWRANTYKVSLNEEPKSYTVSFNLNGGFGSIPSQTITETTPLTYPTNPTRNGYVFGGWYLDANCTEQYTFSGVIDSNLMLYARWVSCTINNDSSYPWNLSNGVLTSTNKRDSSSSTYKITAPVALTVSFSYKVSSESNYDFLIIKKNGSELKKISGSTSYVSYSVDLNANDYLTFTYSKDGSQSSGSDCAYISGIAYSSKVSYSSTATVSPVNYTDVTFGSSFTLSTDIARTGYTFAGWYDGVGGTGTQYTDAEGNSVRVWDKAENTTLYPKWNVNQYTISFVSNGGSDVDSITQDYGSTVTAPAKPTWNEKSFVGWFTDSSLTNEYQFITMPAENITLYAKWIEYSVSLSNDETTEISINDVITSSNTYHATAIDTDGNPVNVVVTVIGGTFEAGKTVTVRLVATGLNGIYATKTISNIKVYGTPALSYNTEKDYFNLSDTLDATLWNANAADTFGTALRVSVLVKEANYSAGDRVTIVISATDITGNEVKVEIANVKVYGAPTITRDTTKNDMKATDTVGNELFGVSAVDSFGESLTVTTVKQSGTISGGNTITVKSSATDSKGNTHYITYTIKVYGLPTIGGATKTSFKVGDNIGLPFCMRLSGKFLGNFFVKFL